MPVRIRLRRMGKKKQPFYRIVAVDSRGRRDGIYLDKIGHYNPLTDPAEIVINEDKALLWLNRGAEPSDTVKSMFRKQGLILKWTLMKQGLDEDRVSEEMKKWEVLQIERKKRKEAEAIQMQREEEQKSEEQELEKEAKPEPVSDKVTEEEEPKKDDQDDSGKEEAAMEEESKKEAQAESVDAEVIEEKEPKTETVSEEAAEDNESESPSEEKTTE